MKLRWLAFVLLLLAGKVFAQSSLPMMELTVGFHRIEAEVAATQAHRMTGPMHRQSMPPQHGMLFVFPELNTHCMWMRNTLLPLSVAFLDEAGTIVNIADMKPQTEINHCAKRPARYALEMNIGWFAAKGIKAGTQIGGIQQAPRPL